MYSGAFILIKLLVIVLLNITRDSTRGSYEMSQQMAGLRPGAVRGALDTTRSQHYEDTVVGGVVVVVRAPEALPLGELVVRVDTRVVAT